MSIHSRIMKLEEEAIRKFKYKKSDTLVMIIPDSDKWIINICHNYKTGEEDTALREQLNECKTFEEVEALLEGYSTNLK